MIKRDELFIGGEWVAPGAGGSIEVRSPADGSLIGVAPAATAPDIDLAVERARTAFEAGEWAGLAIEARIGVIEAMSRLLEPKLGEILELVTAEMGIPIRLSRSLHREMALASVEHACAAARRLELESEHVGATRALLRLEPVGVVAAIAPWNGPFVQSLYKTVYPLLTGCSVVFKPSPETPLDAFYVAEAAVEAGLPEGVLSIVPGGRETGDHLVRSAGVDAVFFTGSTATGQKIGAVCGAEMKRAVLELGGKSAAVVLEDAEPEQTLGFLANGAFGNSGQNCAATSRILVPQDRVEEYAERLAEAARGLTVGNPLEETTDLGPLISAAQLQKVESFVDEAVAAGAELRAGGRRPEGLDAGNFYEPTVLTGVKNSDRVCQEEIFGPVACIVGYRSEEEAVRMANDSPYGLHGTVFSADNGRALAVARAVRAGTFSVNSFMLNSECPYGGYKMSGVGRKYGVEGLREFLETKTINFAGTGTFSFSE